MDHLMDITIDLTPTNLSTGFSTLFLNQLEGIYK